MMKRRHGRQGPGAKWQGPRALGLPAVFVAALVCLLVAAPAFAHAVPGRMTGGGSVFTPNGNEVRIGNSGRVTHGFQLHCGSPFGTPPQEPNNLQINWQGNRFHLTTLTEATCFEDENIDQTPPAAPFDTMVGEGTGRYNNRPGASIRFTFVDAGEPGTRDTAQITILFNGAVVLNVPTANLTFGNHQAHAA